MNGSNNEQWTFDHLHNLYYHAPTSTYAVPDAITGEWRYIPAREFTLGETSTSTATKGHGHAADLDVGKEEGEIEDGVGWGGLMEPEQLQQVLNPQLAYEAASTTDQAKETPKHILRLVVEESGVLNEGDVAIIDAREGGIQIGRDRCERGQPVRLRLKEMEVSKTHAVVYWGDGGEWDEGWFAVDLGSTHGTHIDEKRLSEAKHSSKPGRLQHLSKMRIASTTFVIHDHPQWPCDACQLGRENEIRLDDGAGVQPSSTSTTIQNNANISVAMSSKEKKENREVKRKLEMAALKESLLAGHGKNNANGRSKEATPTGTGEKSERVYVDRAEMRRALHPRSPGKQRRSLSPPTRGAGPIIIQPSQPVQSVFAANMMAAQGWTPGAGLGKDGSGRSTPIEVEVRGERRGLGTQAKIDVEHGGDWRQRGKQRRYEDYGKI